MGVTNPEDLLYNNLRNNNLFYNKEDSLKCQMKDYKF